MDAIWPFFVAISKIPLFYCTNKVLLLAHLDQCKRQESGCCVIRVAYSLYCDYNNS